MKGASTYRAVQAVSPGKLELTELPFTDEKNRALQGWFGY